MDPQDALQTLSDMLHGRFFDPVAYVQGNSLFLTDMVTRLRVVSILLFMVFLLLEVNRRLMRDLSGRPFDPMPLLLGASLLAVGIAIPEAYIYLCRIIISTGAFVARAIDNVNVQVVGMEVQNLTKGVLLGTLNPVSLFTALFELLNPLTLISVIMYWLATGLLFVMPILQGVFLGLFIILGPVLLPAAIFKPFNGVAQVWLYSMLAASFFSVFGIIAYTAIAVTGILSLVAESQSNVFLSATYSTVTILVILCIPKVSFSFFRGSYASVSRGVSMVRRVSKIF